MSTEALRTESVDMAPPLWLRAATLLLRGASRLSFRSVTRLGAVLGWLLYLLPTRRKSVARTNLALCFPAMPSSERDRLLRRHFAALAQMILEYGYCWYAPRAMIESLVRIDGLEHLRALNGRPFILSMPHFTGMDLVGLRLSFVQPLVTVYSRQKNPHIDAFFRQGRLRFETGRVYSRQDGIRPVLKAVKSGLGLYYLPDQDHGVRDSVFADFFGVPAATLSSLSRLAALTGAAVLPCVPRRERDGYTLVIEPPLADFPGPDAVHDAQRINRTIERQVQAQPQQYYWLHRRFKTRPPGQPAVYS